MEYPVNHLESATHPYPEDSDSNPGGSAVPITEHTINDALASVLRAGRRAWRDVGIVHSETTGMLKDAAGRPDILVLEHDVSRSQSKRKLSQR